MNRENISPDHDLFVKNRFKFIRANWPTIEGMQPAELTEQMIRDWMTKLTKKGYAAATIRGTMLCFRQACVYAHTSNLCRENPMAKIKLPVPKRSADHQKHKLTTVQFDSILEEMRRLKSNSAKAADLADLLAATGCRISEVVGNKKRNLPPIRWRDVEWPAPGFRGQITMGTAKGRVASAEGDKRRAIPFHPRLEATPERCETTRASE